MASECQSQFALSSCDCTVMLEQRHHSWLLIRVNMLVKQSKLIETPVIIKNEEAQYS